MLRFWLTIGVLVFLAHTTQAVDYYVSPSGSDTNSGTVLGQAFKTIQQAANLAQPGDNVYICGGTYRESVTVPRSGTAGAPINFQPYAGQQVTITGLDTLNASWTNYSGPIYSSTPGSGISQVFINGKVVNQAQWPNPVYNNPLRSKFATVATGSVDSVNSTATITSNNLSGVADGTFSGAKVSIRSGNSGSSGNAEYVFFQGANVTQIGTSLTYQWPPPTHPTGVGSYYNPAANNAYYVYGSVAAISAGNQWYNDAATGKLYIQTASGATPAGSNIEVRKRMNGFDVNGQSYVNVSGIRFKAANVLVTGDHNVVNNCQILYPTPFQDPKDWYSIPGVTVSGQYNTIKNSEIGYTWGDGVSVLNANNTVDNCVIHDVDWSGGGSAGVKVAALLTQAASVANNAITNNTIYNCGRPDINSAGSKPEGGYASNANLLISHNNVSRFGYLCKDVGAINWSYQVSADAGDVVSYNVVHDSRAPGGINVGIYMDAGNAGNSVHHNVVYGVQRGLIENAITGWTCENNNVYNNTLWGITGYAMTPGTTSGFTNCNTWNNICNTISGGGGTSWCGNATKNLTTSTNQFVNSAAGDYRLSSSSVAAVNYGTTIGGLPSVPDGTPDAGAFEYGQPGWTAGASFKTWTFANQVDVPISSAFYVAQTAPTTTVTSGTLTVGNTSSTANRDNRAFLKFDLSSLSGKTITSAVFRLYENNTPSDGTKGVSLYKVTSNWVDYSSTTVDLASKMSFYDQANLDLYTDVDITSIVQGWLANPATNFGLSLRSDYEGSTLTAKYFEGLYGVTIPELLVTYAVPEPAVAVLLGLAALAGLGLWTGRRV
jgi:hypothetical protein